MIVGPPRGSRPMVVNTVVPKTRPVIHHLMQALQGLGWPTVNGTEVDHTDLHARRKPDGRDLKEHDAFI